jgi:hypothetical protein
LIHRDRLLTERDQFGHIQCCSGVASGSGMPHADR